MTASEALAAEVRFLLKQIERGDQKLNLIRGETEGAPPEDMEQRLRRALGACDEELLTHKPLREIVPVSNLGAKESLPEARLTPETASPIW